MNWTAVQEGDAILPLDAQVDLAGVVKYLGATWNFTRIFFDRDYAQRQGLPDTIVPGPLKLSLLSRMLIDWLEGAGEIRSIRCAYRRTDIPGLLRCRGLVLRSYEQSGERRLDCQLWIENDSGRRSASGAATVVCYLTPRPPSLERKGE
ncbi:MAG: hypothetical protein ACR2PL_08385 [Dehalococcoidia bacterium]